jgi:hypothetical protein
VIHLWRPQHTDAPRLPSLASGNGDALERTMPARGLFYFIGAWLLVIALVARFLGANKQRPGKAWLPFLGGGMLFLVWGACGGFYAIYTFTDRIRAHRSLDPDAIVAIEVLPGRHPAAAPSLVPQRLVVTDRQRIAQLVRALAGAEPWAAAHPRVNWQCSLRVDDGTRKDSYLVSSTTNNGVLIAVESEWLLLGEYREDSLKEVLEQIAAAGKSSAREGKGAEAPNEITQPPGPPEEISTCPNRHGGPGRLQRLGEEWSIQGRVCHRVLDHEDPANEDVSGEAVAARRSRGNTRTGSPCGPAEQPGGRAGQQSRHRPGRRERTDGSEMDRGRAVETDREQCPKAPEQGGQQAPNGRAGGGQGDYRDSRSGRRPQGFPGWRAPLRALGVASGVDDGKPW